MDNIARVSGLLRRALLVSTIAALLATILPMASADATPGAIREAGKAIPGSYLVTLRSDVSDVASAATRLARLHDGELGYIYSHALKGFSIQLTRADALALSADPHVQLVEQDPVVRAVATQSPATWGLDRTDQRNLPLNNSYSYNATGAGTTSYVIDTGIRISHSDLGGRASHGYDFVDGDTDASDCNGHGTHVAGTIGGNAYGIAKQTSLVAVRVLDCAGSGAGADI